MSEGTSGTPSSEGQDDNPVPALKVCAECGRGVRHLKRKKCGTCYMRERRGGGMARREPLDPDVAALLLPVPGTSASFAERVFTYVDPSGDCWEWTGALDDNGYGVIGRGGRGSGNMGAHCAVWLLLVGPIPKGMHYDHLCRRHSCVSPEHAEIVPPAINKERGFSPAVLYSKRTKCNFGHPLDGITTRKTGETYRYCKTCARNKTNARRAAATAA